MKQVTSKDGTIIAFDQSGNGNSAPLILISGGPNDRSANTPLAELLSPQLSVINYDRRGRGDSGDTKPYAVAREVEDLDALIQAAGGSAFIYGTSSGAAFALEAARQLGGKISKMALWEPPFIVDNSRPPVPADYKTQLSQMITADRRGDAIEYFMTRIVGIPAEFVAPMRLSPYWAGMEKLAHVIVYEADVMKDYALPAGLGTINVPTLVLDGAQMPWLSKAAQAVAADLPQAQHRVLAGQPHNVDPAAIAPVLLNYFAS